MLTIKSDDVMGRAKAYESIIRNEPIEKPSVPASFNVLVRELQGLGLSPDMIGGKEIIDEPRRPLDTRRPEPISQILEKEKEEIKEVIAPEEKEDIELTEIFATQEVEPETTEETTKEDNE